MPFPTSPSIRISQEFSAPAIAMSLTLLNPRLPTGLFSRNDSNIRQKKSLSIISSTCVTSIQPENPIASFLINHRSKRYTIKDAKLLHAYIIKSTSTSDPNIYFINSIIHIYASNGDLASAHKLFDRVPHRDVVSWTTLVAGYAKLGKMCHAQELFDAMPERNIVSWNVLISGYGKCGNVEAAQRVFDEMEDCDIVSWNSLISSYTRNGFADEAFRVFTNGLSWGAIIPNRETLLSVLPAIAECGYDLWGRCVHSYIIRSGIEVDSVLCSALVDMYSKCDCLDMAYQVFESNPFRGSVASWNPIFAGLSRNQRYEQVLSFFRLMQAETVEPDYVTMVSVLPAIAYSGSLSLGKWVHSYIQKMNIRMNATLTSALVDMYSKCGCIELAVQVFSATKNKTTELWNAMITGLAIHGRGRDALKLFTQMQAENVGFDDVTVSAILNACSHSGLVDEGLSFFSTISEVYKMTPKIQHYGCIVDILGRAGRLNEAKDMICNKMPIKPDVIIWKSLLGACKIHGNVEIGEFAAKEIINLLPDDSSSYVLMSSIYDAAGRSNDAILMRKKMIDGGVKKEPGFSCIESGGVVHKFLVGDKSHPRAEEIYVMLGEMREKLRAKGYVPNKNLVLFDILDSEKEDAIFYHSEKLAAAFGLINCSRRDPLRIVKNLRMCSDCHVFMKLVSVVYDQEIVVRDHNRFHHFLNGRCSCMDYWQLI